MAWKLPRLVRLSARTRVFLIILVALVPLTIVSPATALESHETQGATWSRTYASIVGANRFALTSDGGFIIAAHAGFVVGGQGLEVRVMKANSKGVPEWERDYHPAGYSYSTDVIQLLQTSDRGYLVVGEVFFLGAGYRPIFNPLLLKLNHQGDVLWSKVYDAGSFSFVEQASDGGYIVAGNFGTIGAHDSNGWVLRLDGDGSIMWQETFEGQDIYSVDQTRDHGFVVAGTVGVGDKAEAWVFKLDPDGNLVWQKAYLVSDESEAYSVQETPDRGYIVAGHSSVGALILRLDKNGNVTWVKSLGGGFTAWLASQTSDGGSIVVGGFLLRLDAYGNKIWMKTYDPNGVVEQALETRQGEIMAAGFLQTSCCGRSAWVLRLDSMGSIGGCGLGYSSNATLIDSQSKMTITTIPSVSTNATANATSVQTIGSSVTVQTQCFNTSSVGKGDDRDEELAQ